MAAIDLSATTTFPLARKLASVGTTWQEVILPDACEYVTVQPDAIAYCAMPNSGQTDGAAVSGTAYDKVTANTAKGYNVRGKTETSAAASPRSIFVAAATGTTDVYLILDGKD